MKSMTKIVIGVPIMLLMNGNSEINVFPYLLGTHLEDPTLGTTDLNYLNIHSKRKERKLEGNSKQSINLASYASLIVTAIQFPTTS